MTVEEYNENEKDLEWRLHKKAQSGFELEVGNIR